MSPPSTSHATSSTDADGATKTFLLVTMFQGPNSQVNDLVAALQALVQSQGGSHGTSGQGTSHTSKSDMTARRDKANHKD
ncbi:hypothetical protein NLJ89_g2454 [Agrocybe chaxingu]|uniref:Uncharacterized protein n=1 Tax=Agrocybe chaxingu TaxID=84603 RepID=A0A9W8K4D1_9AGAR|nr:hypothetical protein NLJ89_g2454 [Agrocybe chaxingu]